MQLKQFVSTQSLLQNYYLNSFITTINKTTNTNMKCFFIFYNAVSIKCFNRDANASAFIIRFKT